MKKYNNSNSNKKPKKNSGKNTSSAKAKSKKLKLKVKETGLPPSNYNGGGVFTLDDVKNYNDTTTVSEASTYITTVDASKQESQLEPVITALPNKEELYSKYTETEEETSTHANNLLPKANTDGVNTMIIIAGAFALLAFLVLILS